MRTEALGRLRITFECEACGEVAAFKIDAGPKVLSPDRITLSCPHCSKACRATVGEECGPSTSEA